MTRDEKLIHYRLALVEAHACKSQKALDIAVRLAAELGYRDPRSVPGPAAAAHPALLELEKALDGAPAVAGSGGDTWE